MRRYLQFNIGVVLAVSFLCALLFSRYAIFWTVVLLSEGLLIWTAIEILSRRIPATLSRASDSNFQRFDGSVSRRRESRERKAKLQFRIDLFGALIIVAMSCNWVVLLIDSLVIPLPVAAETLAVFSFDSSAWGSEIRNRNLDSEYAAWLGIENLGDRKNRPKPHFVRVTFPTVACTALLWLIGSCVFLVYSYKQIVEDYAAGIDSRSQEYLNIDVGRKKDSSSQLTSLGSPRS